MNDVLLLMARSSNNEALWNVGILAHCGIRLIMLAIMTVGFDIDVLMLPRWRGCLLIGVIQTSTILELTSPFDPMRQVARVSNASVIRGQAESAATGRRERR